MSKSNPNGVDHIARLLYGAAFLTLGGTAVYAIWKAMQNVVPIMEMIGFVVVLVICYALGYVIEEVGDSE